MYQRLSDEDFKFIFEKVPRLCVDLVIQSEKGILLSLRDIEPGKGLWHIPGGMLRKDEALHEAIQRIALAETGLSVEIIRMLGPIEYPDEIQHDWMRHSVSIAYLVRPISGHEIHDFQSKELTYVTEIPANMYPGQTEFLQSFGLLR